MRTIIFLLLVAAWIECKAQQEKPKTLVLKDTLESLTKTGIVARTSYDCEVQYLGMPDIKILSEYCHDEIRQSIRAEIAKLYTENVLGFKLESDIKPGLISIFEAHGLKLKMLVVKKL
jgi:hypothetical protein